MVKKAIVLAVVVFAGAATVVNLGACGVSCEDNLTCAPDASADSPGTDAPANCDLSKDPKDSPACVDDSVGIFVDSTNGSDSNVGSKASPVKTIATALTKTNAQHVRVYVCEGTYPEDLLLDAAHDGISMFGGWKCADWTYSATKPIIGKTQSPSKLDSLTKAVVLEDLEVDAVDGDTTNLSSIAMFVNGCTNVALTRVKLVARTGHSGASGGVSDYTYPAQSTLNGNAADGGAPGPANTYSACLGGGTTVGGAGGASGANGNPGTPGDAGAGGTVVACINNNAGGGNGSGGGDGSNGPGASSTGALAPNGWSPTNGGDGQTGSVGQGGGGGAGASLAGGGGGGAGGCGGALGTKGFGGGGSVALTVLMSGITVNNSVLIAASAGDGGSGGVGQPGQSPGGFGGNPGAGGCQGGKGGAGGAGGSGGGGAGGVSAGIVWKGNAAPTLDGATQSAVVVASKGGAKGAGGSGNDGVDGVAQTVMQAP